MSEAPYDPMTGQPFTRLPDKVKIIAPRDSFCSTHENSQQALHLQLIYVKNLRRRIKEIIESENHKRRQTEPESEAENRTEREADAGNREEQEAATEDRTVSETVTGNQEEQETGNGDRAKPDKPPGFQFVMVRDNRFLAEPEPDQQADLQTVRQQLVSLIAARANGKKKANDI
ncbi:MAG: hypothetical protein F4Y42_21420 [Caldilineaceae bacterium SB0664_bin_27]|uniref:Uncharacterized protein n=1 Tax=Caldilineaceae bacterium SB0664_bin_27 TaxID=2605260 RepID=A0A6B0Z171_9CHLR|nr:hypothetical protein [Caldilineaceae bacterium SB0664_bin_27]